MDAKEKPVCPKCGSENVRVEKIDLQFASGETGKMDAWLTCRDCEKREMEEARAFSPYGIPADLVRADAEKATYASNAPKAK